MYCNKDNHRSTENDICDGGGIKASYINKLEEIFSYKKTKTQQTA